MTHYLKSGNSILFLLFLFLLYSCEKNSTFQRDELPITVISEHNFSEAFVGLTTPNNPYFLATYPNPFVNTLYLYSGTIPDQIIISDADGRTKKIITEQHDIQIDFGDCKPGFYYCEILIGEKVLRQQLIKSKN